MKLDILAIGAHPDDVELSCSGTLAKEVDRGKKIGILDLTRGEMGTRGTAETRKEEAAEASRILRLSMRHNLGFKDAFFVNDESHQREIIKIIRKYRPEIVFCNAVEDRHIDHGRGARLATDACFLSGLRKVQTEWEGEPQEQWRPRNVYHYIQWKNLQPDIVVDISGYIDIKLAAVKAYRTQFFNKDSEEPKTPISSDNFLESITYRARDLGRLINTDHAEGFTVERYPAVDSIFDLI